MKKVKTTSCTFSFSTFRTLWQRHLPEKRRDARKPQEKTRRGKNTKSGGSDPIFLGFCRPKKRFGSLPPCGTGNCAGCFFRGAEKSFETLKKEKQHAPD